MVGEVVDRRTLVRAVGAAGAGALGGCTGFGGLVGERAGSYPTEDLEIIVSWGTGGGFDYYARLVANHLEDRVDVDATVDNVTGGVGMHGRNTMYSAEPDGHTFMIIHHPHSSLTQVNRDPEYDVERMTWLPGISRGTRVAAVSTDSDVESWEELTGPLGAGDLRIGVTGPTDLGTINLYKIGDVGGYYEPEVIPENIVSYDGYSAVIQGMLRGDVQVYAGTLRTALPFVESGDLRPVLVTTTGDPPGVVADVSTLTDIGLGEDDGRRIADMVNTRRAFAGPPDVPDETAATLRGLLTEVIRSDDLQAEAADSERPVQYLDSARMEEIAVNGLRTWRENSDLLDRISEIASEG